MGSKYIAINGKETLPKIIMRKPNHLLAASCILAQMAKNNYQDEKMSNGERKFVQRRIRQLKDKR